MTIALSEVLATMAVLISIIGSVASYLVRSNAQKEMEGRYIQKIDHLERKVDSLEEKLEKQQHAFHKEQMETRKLVNDALMNLTNSISELKASIAGLKTTKSSRTPA